MIKNQRRCDNKMDFESCFQLNELEFSYDILNNCKDIEEYGTPQVIWGYLIMKYGTHVPMSYYQSENNFKFACELLFSDKEIKYKKLKETLKEYDPMKPYLIEEIRYIGEKRSGETSTPSGKQVNTKKGTTYDNTSDLKVKEENEVSYNGYKVENEYKNNIEETFQDETFSGLTSSMKKKSKLSGNIGNHSFSELMEKERKVANFSLTEEICKDIIDATCYKIFKY